MKLAIIAVLSFVVIAGCTLAGAAHVVHAAHVTTAVSCGWHAFRAAHDASHGHALYTAWQSYQTAHHCGRLIP